MPQTILAELIGTAILIFLGTSVSANVTLHKTKGHNSGWLVITVGWALAVMIPAFIFNPISGAHFNPALTIALTLIGQGPSSGLGEVLGYIAAQFIGTIIGATLAYIQYKDHFDVTPDADSKLGVFATSPAIRNMPLNFMSEFLATFILVFTILGISNSQFADALDIFGVGAIILVIGLCLGGSTGYAINPARDLGSRIAYAILPIKNKRDPDWEYAWVPVAAPILGAICGAWLSTVIF